MYIGKIFKCASVCLALSICSPVITLPCAKAAEGGSDEINPDAVLWYDEYAQNDMDVVQPPSDSWAQNAKWDYEEVRALPIGNGRLGAMVYGGTDTEHLQINEETVWTGGPHNYANVLDEPLTKDSIDSSLADILGDDEVLSTTAEVYAKASELVLNGETSKATSLIDKYFLGDERYQTSFQPFVDLWLDFGHNFDKTENYRRALDLENALATVDYDYDGAHYSREAFASYPDQVIAMKVAAEGKELSFTARMDSKQNYEVSKISDNELSLKGTVKSEGGMFTNTLPNAIHFEARLIIDTDGKAEFADNALKVSGASYAEVYVTGGTNYIDYLNLAGYGTDANGNVIMDSRDDEAAYTLAGERCEAVKAHMSGKTYEEIKAAHTADYKSLYSRSEIDFSGDSASDIKSDTTDMRIARFDGYNDLSLVKLYFNYGKYLLISSSRSTDGLQAEYDNKLPKGQPANLQGIWSWKTAPGWGSKYTANINAEMNYFMADAANLSEMNKPLFDAIGEIRKSGERTAKTHYGVDTDGAWVLHHNFDIWRGTAPVDLATSGMWPTGGAWLALHLWQYYEYNNDEDFLRDTAYDILKGSAEFFEGYLKEYTDPETGEVWLVSPASISPEHGNVQLSPTMDNALIRNLLAAAAKSADILGTDPEKAELWREMADRLPPYMTAKSGNYLREWLVDGVDERVGDAEHRHPSQLWGLHPGRDVTPYDNTPEEQEIFDAFINALERRGEGATGWSVAWRTAMWARAGYADKAYSQLTALIKKATAPNLFDMHPDDVFQIDGNFGGAAAIIEMLMQSGDDAVTILPALPAEWRSGSFRGLKAVGGHEIDLAWSDGNAQSAVIRAGKDGGITLRYIKGVKDAVISCNGEQISASVSENGEKLTFEAQKGMEYTVTGFSETAYEPAPEITPPPAPTPRPKQYLQNADMEGAPSGGAPYYWGAAKANDADNVTESADSDAHGGNRSLLIANRSVPASAAQQYLSLDNDTAYTVSAWVKSGADDTVNLKIRYDYWQDDIAASKAVRAGEWTEISGAYTTRANGKVTQLIIDTTETAAELRVDDASVMNYTGGESGGDYPTDAPTDRPKDTAHTVAALAQGDTLNDPYTHKNELFTTDMVHNNPALEPYTSNYTNAEFLAQRNFDGTVFSLYDCAQYGLLWDEFDEYKGASGDAKIFPEGSDARKWAQEHRADIKAKYKAAQDAGIKIYFMMDIIVLPAHLKEMYPEILTDGKIDIEKPETQIVMDYMFKEMFTEFPEIDGIYVRYGETYTGAQYGAPYHTGNNPILNGTQTHLALIQYLGDKLYGEKMVDDKPRDVIYRTWGFGSFQNDPDEYLAVSENIPTNDHLYFCVKHSTGDFHRNVRFNQTIGIGQHQQIIEVQAAREYEGKGAFPNYICDGVINGFEEYEWLMTDKSQNQSLRDVINTAEYPQIKGIWTWSRGGGWNGSYINGVNGIVGDTESDNREVTIKDGSEMWDDLNAYVMTQWAKDTSKTDKYYVKQYAREYLGMDETDAERFYRLCILSARAVLLGRATDNSKISWRYDVWWMRDQNISPSNFRNCVNGAIDVNQHREMLEEKAESVALWREMIDIAESFTTDAALIDSPVKVKDYILTTCKYGYYFFSLAEQMHIAGVEKKLGDDSGVYNTDAILGAVSKYDRLWEEWEELYRTAPGCPSLFAKENRKYSLIGYNGNTGLDGFMDSCRETLSIPFDTVRVETGKTAELHIEYSYGTSPDNFTFESSSPNVAYVNNAGQVVGSSAGRCVITVTSKSGLSVSVTVEVADRVEPLWSEDFSDSSSAEGWTGTGAVEIADGALRVSGMNSGEVIFNLPEVYKGGVTVTFNMKVNNTSDRGFFRLANSESKHINQLEFRGSAAPKNTIALDWSGDMVSICDAYAADTRYTVTMDVDTLTKTQTIAVDGGSSDTHSGYKHEVGDNTGIAQIHIGTRGGAVLEIDDIAIYAKGAAEPETGLEISQPYYENGEPLIKLTNHDADAVNLDIIAASYDADGRLGGAKITRVTAAGGAETETGFDAAAGDTVYIWKENMEPLTAPFVLKAAGN